MDTMQVVTSKTANAKLESELKQERANHTDLQKVLCDERKLMSTMDMEHQSHLVELEQTHQEKVGRGLRSSAVIYFYIWEIQKQETNLSPKP